MRRAHGLIEEGTPFGKRRVAKCGMRAATSPTLITFVKPRSRGEEGAPPLKSVGCHLKGAPPLQRGAHFPIDTWSKSNIMSSIKSQSS